MGAKILGKPIVAKRLSQELGRDEKVDSPVRLMRILKLSFLVSGVLFLYVVFTIPAKSPGPVNPAIELVLTILAITNVVLGFTLPQFLARVAMRSPQSTLQPTPVKL